MLFFPFYKLQIGNNEFDGDLFALDEGKDNDTIETGLKVIWKNTEHHFSKFSNISSLQNDSPFQECVGTNARLVVL